MLAGEYIQHYCPDAPPNGNAGIKELIHNVTESAVTTTTPPPSSGWHIFGWLVFLLLAGGALFAGYYFWSRRQKGKKQVKQRGLAQTAPVEYDAAPAPPMPTDNMYAAPPPYEQQNGHDPNATYYTAWHDMSSPAGGDYQVQNVTRLVHGSRFPGDYHGAEALFNQHTDPTFQGAKPYPVIVIGPQFKQEKYWGDHSTQYVDDFRSWWEAQEHAEEPQVQQPQTGLGYMPLSTQESALYTAPSHLQQPEVHVPLTKPLLNMQGSQLGAPQTQLFSGMPFAPMPTTTSHRTGAPMTMAAPFSAPQYASAPSTFSTGNRFAPQPFAFTK